MVKNHALYYRIIPREIGQFTLTPNGVQDPYPGLAGWEGTSPLTNWLCAEFSGNRFISPYDGHHPAVISRNCSGQGSPRCNAAHLTSGYNRFKPPQGKF
ncbi:unnamed protein product [Hermetia illucens]|uniref:Uncharacterized protein n=1 Tax=Hermetia illucens TaxID=343691 RepID=A0A7R8YTG9_HERIL|nr:unnamed protein product [Hermetia illucens]